MKPNKCNPLSARYFRAGLASIIVASGLPLAAQSISVNFGANQSASAITDAGKTAGAVPIAGNFWNNTTVNGGGTLGSLLDSTGATTAASVTWTANNTWQSGSPGATATSENGLLTKGYLDDGGGWTVKLASPYLLNDIYIIHATDTAGGQISAVSVNGTFYKGNGAGATVLASGSGDSWTASLWSNADALIESDNFIKILGQPAVSLAAFAASPGRAAIAGVQVVNAYAGTLSYWDTDGDFAGSGGSAPAGLWTAANWSPSEAGTAATAAWTPGHGAVFSAGSDATDAYTITLSDTQTVDSIWAQDGTVTLSGGILDLSAGTGILRGDQALVVDSQINAVNLTTAGFVDLNNASNTVAGVATINGEVYLGANHTFPQIAGGGTLNIATTTLTLGGAANSIYGGTFAGTGTIDKVGAGTLTLGSVSGGFAGAATVSAGTLDMSGAGNLSWNISGAGNFAKSGSGQLTVVGNITTAGTLNVAGGILQVGNVGVAGSIGNPSAITLATNDLALRYRLSGADATLDSSSVTFGGNDSQLRQHGGTATDKLIITNTTIAGTTTDANGNAVQGRLSSEGGVLVFGTGTTAAAREIYLLNGNVEIESGANVTARYLNIGNGGGASGVVTQTGGNVTVQPGNFGIRIGHWSGAGRAYNISGGSLDASGIAANAGDARYLAAGWDGEGDMTIGGGVGTATVKSVGMMFDLNRTGAGGSASTATLLTNGVLEIGSLGILGQGDNDGLVMSGGLVRSTASSIWDTPMATATATSSTIEIGSGNTVTYSKPISGDGALAKTGDGILILTGVANTYTGALSVDGGTLRANSALAAPITVNSGGVLNANAALSGALTVNSGGKLSVNSTLTSAVTVASGGSIGVGSNNSGTVGSLSLASGSSSTFAIGGSTTGAIGVTAANGLSVASTHTINVQPASVLTAGDQFPVYTYSGALQGAGIGGFTLTPLTNTHYSLSLVNTGSSIDVKVDSVTPVVWTAVPDNIWNLTTTNWNDGSAVAFQPGDIATFNDLGANEEVVVDATGGAIAPAAMVFNNTTATTYTLSGGPVSGVGGIIKTGDGTLIVNNANTFTGASDIQNGTLALGHAGALGASGNVTLLGSAATLDLRGMDLESTGQVIKSAGTIINSAATAGVMTDLQLTGNTVIDGANSIHVGPFAGATGSLNLAGNTLVKNGTGQLVLNGVSVTSGDITVNEGSIRLMKDYNAGNQRAISLTSPGNLTINAGASVVTNRWGPGFTITMPIVLNGGTFGSSWPGPNGATIAAPVNVTADSFFNFGGGYGNVTFSGVISGTGKITRTGGETVYLTGNNTTSGGFVINSGNLQVGRAGTTGTLGSGPVTINSTLIFDRSDNFTVVNAIGGTGQLIKRGGETMTLTGISTYTGNTTVEVGALALADGAQLTFAPKANGVSNKITGAGVVFLSGDFSINTTGADLTDGNSWLLVDRAALALETFASTFGLVGFTETADVHTRVEGGRTWTFTEATGVLSLAVAASGYNTWAAINAPTGTSADDYDGDGVANGIEYVLGGTKDTNDLDKLPTIDASGGNLVFSFVRDQQSLTADTAVTIEVGPDLATWPDSYSVGAASAGPVTIVDNGDGTDTVTLSVAKGTDTEKFARLKVTITL